MPASVKNPIRSSRPSEGYQWAIPR